jgi:hypothetical protein
MTVSKVGLMAAALARKPWSSFGHMSISIR